VVRLITLGRLQLLRDGPPTEPVHLQPKRLALLAYLALAAGDACQQRDTLLALFWPRSDRGSARRSQRQTLFHLRNELGDGVIVNRGRAGIALAADRVWCDAVAVEAALKAGRPREALDLYGGDFLPGLHVEESGAELEEWIERTRRQIRARVVAGAWELAEQEERRQRTTSALELAGLARRLSPDDEQGLRRQMMLLAGAGDPAAALTVYAEFARRLRQEYDAEPSAESRALAGSLKQGGLLPVAAREIMSSAAVAAARPPADPTEPDAVERRRWMTRLVPIAAAVAVGFALASPLVRSPTVPVDLVLTQFNNHTRDSLLGVAVTEAVREELSKFARVDLAGARAVAPAGAAPSAEAGRVLIVVTGDISALGHGFTVSAKLVTADSARPLAVIQESATDTGLLLPTVKRLSERVRGNVLGSLPPTGEDGVPARRISRWFSDTDDPAADASAGPRR
jgi:DNA-binding SARP family transcriptional activator